MANDKVKKVMTNVMKSELTIDREGNKEWRLPNGNFHREDEPAIEYYTGGKVWIIKGKLHRENGPAVEGHKNNKEWWYKNERHREDGPAIESGSGRKQWWLNNKRYSEEQFKRIMRLKKLEQIL